MGLCSTCNVDVSADDRRNHVHSEWHVYNLKRLIANLPPISEELFAQKKQLFSEASSVDSVRKTYCEVCKTPFANNRSYEAHLKSKKHIKNSELKSSCLVNEATLPAPAAPNQPDTEELDPPKSLPLGACLFCDRQFSTDMQNTCESGRNESLARRLLDHMSDAHHFVIPYPENLIDPAGLLTELGRIVGEERACLACGRQFYGRRFHSSSSQKPNSHVALTAVRQHMLDKPGHMRLWCGEDDPLQVALTIAKAEEAGETSPPPAALAGGELFSRFYDKSVVAPSFILPDTEDGVYEVRLPSGTVLGHRNLASIYRQHLPPIPTDVTLINQHALPSSRVTHTSRALVPSHIGPLCVRPQLRLPIKARADERHLEASRRAWELSTGIQGNLVLRAHLRRQY
ncbi:hypothetical protein CRM22_004995 [Opisthorchis felineus]|uniref:C2H2-type domain-containing protein n=1 Tax=Opisthorchis felineus TaxID=147828 RepID=A0A4S2M056_OPIFE|nr:hypothetical protein CRM22_004995 [Opisthorchis felineus]